ncbi:MBL fold metallo-hydrolase [Thalassobacillus hwangdonensis]|uniref:MBL fold metallo-hydrolase n=1 Tax=Thalassobacillus hwangdonensis TaxID=546108 RepID=A0ABW3L1T8_9BACI
MTRLKQKIAQITVPTPFAVGDVHLYVLKGDRLSIVDAGVKTEEAWEACQIQLKELGYRPEDIEQIILTHHHPDHIGLVERFTNARDIVAHANVNPWLKRDEAFFSRYETFFAGLYKEAGVPVQYEPFLKALRKPLMYTSEGEVTHTLVEGDSLPGHEGWTVLETPGHAQSHLSFYQEQDGSLIAGDHVLEHISSNPLLEPPYQEGEARPKPQLQYRHSLEKMLDYAIHTVYPGHGEVFGDPHPLIRKRLTKQAQRADHVRRIIGNEKMTAFQVCERLFPKHIETQFGLTMSETFGQLDFLLDRKLIDETEQNGVVFYENVRDSNE